MTTNMTKLVLPISLMAIMALTRFHHFGSAFTLPDASIAVFFLAGMLASGGLWLFSLLLLEAGVIDYVAITQFSVSDFCISPAYACLILAYGVMWLVGRYCKVFVSLNVVDSAKTFGLATFATTMAFMISNGSFYLFSGQFGELSWQQYLDQTFRYLPPYLSSALLYIVLGLAAIKLWKAMHTMDAGNRDIKID
jgi:hypothetical protein